MSLNVYENGTLKKVAGNYETDSALSSTSTNPVQNKIITQEFARVNYSLGIRGYDYVVNRFLRFSPSDRKSLVVKAGTRIVQKNGTVKSFDEDTTVSMGSLTAGKDYFVYVDNDGDVVCSTASTRSDAVKIGRFHTLCANVGTPNMIAPTELTASGGKYLVKSYTQEDDPDFYDFYNKTISGISTGTYYNVATMPHPLSGYQAGDILPESVFCLGFKPKALVEDAMVYDVDMDKCIDIYLQSGRGKATRSAYGQAHTVSRQQWNHTGDMIAVGKELLNDAEFTSAALGSNERTNIAGSTDAGTVGGHSDTAGRRMISAIGCEEMCGFLWQWLREYPTTTTGTAWMDNDGQSAFGQQYYNDHAVSAGGYWGNAAVCGSRSRHSSFVRSYVSAAIGGRGSSPILRNA